MGAPGNEKIYQAKVLMLLTPVQFRSRVSARVDGRTVQEGR